MAGIVQRLAKEPLVQFTAIGLLLFALDRATAPEPVDDPQRTIRIDAEVQARLSGVFREARGRLPTPAEMDRIVERYLKNETLYRKAREMRLDENDEMMRQRLMQRLSMLMYSGIEVDDPSDEVLRAWFEDRVEDYASPATISFRIVGLDGAEAEARGIATRFNALEEAGERVPASAHNLINFRERPRDQIVGLLGEGFVEAVEGTEPEVWTALDSPRGWQVVRFEGATPRRVPGFAEAEGQALSDWRQEQIQRKARDALDGLRDDYEVIREPYLPAHVALDGPAGGPAGGEGTE